MNNDNNIRDLAITLVDGLKGYTTEFAPSSVQHEELYDVMEVALKRALALNSAKVVYVPSTAVPPLSVPCSYCGACADQPCFNRGENIVMPGYHSARWQQSRE